MQRRIKIWALSGKLFSVARRWNRAQRELYRRLLSQIHMDIIDLAKADQLFGPCHFTSLVDDASISAWICSDTDSIDICIASVAFGDGKGWCPSGVPRKPSFDKLELISDSRLSGGGRYWQLEQDYGDEIGAPGPLNDSAVGVQQIVPCPRVLPIWHVGLWPAEQSDALLTCLAEFFINYSLEAAETDNKNAARKAAAASIGLSTNVLPVAETATSRTVLINREPLWSTFARNELGQGKKNISADDRSTIVIFLGDADLERVPFVWPSANAEARLQFAFIELEGLSLSTGETNDCAAPPALDGAFSLEGSRTDTSAVYRPGAPQKRAQIARKRLVKLTYQPEILQHSKYRYECTRDQRGSGDPLLQ